MHNMPGIRRWSPVPLLLCGLLPAVAYGNGINPPRPSGAKTVEAICTDRKSGKATIIQRARITIGEPSGSLELRVGQSPARTLQLSQVIRVQIPAARPTPDGFAKASIELIDPGYKGPGFVRVRAKGKPVRVTGFAADLERIDIPLETCKVLAVEASTSSEPERGEVSKK